MRRCAVSAPANIVEGYRRRTPNDKNDKLQFYYIARGSLTELEYYIEPCYDLKYLTDAELKKLQDIKRWYGQIIKRLY